LSTLEAFDNLFIAAYTLAIPHYCGLLTYALTLWGLEKYAP